MFIVPILTAYAMESHEALRQYESFYESIHPAEVKSDQAFIWLSDIPHPLFNAVMHLSSEGDVEKSVDAIIAKTPAGSPLSFWVHEQNRADGLAEILRERSFDPVISCSLMVWPAQPLAAPQADIRFADRKAFDEITAIAFGFNAAMQEKYSALLDQVEGEFYLIYLDGKPIGTGLLLQQEDTGGIFNIGILPEFKGRGCAKAMIRFLQKRAYELGLRKLVLLSAPDMEKLYADLEFKNVLTIDIYAHGS